jgi:hypothetical protein
VASSQRKLRPRRGGTAMSRKRTRRDLSAARPQAPVASLTSGSLRARNVYVALAAATTYSKVPACTIRRTGLRWTQIAQEVQP